MDSENNKVISFLLNATKWHWRTSSMLNIQLLQHLLPPEFITIVNKKSNKILLLSCCCSKKDAKNRHPEPDTRGATSGRQPPGPGRPLHPSLLWWELDPHPPVSHQYPTIHTTTARRPSHLLQPTNQPTNRPTGVGPTHPHSPSIHPSSCPSRQKIKRRE